MFITADQLLAHAIGDYIMQSHWMACQKTRRSWVCAVHVLSYSLPFFVLARPSVMAFLIIVGSHYLIDRYGLAYHVVLAKNQIAPASGRVARWESGSTGYPATVPTYISAWLFVIADNILHVICNGLALKYF